MKCNQCRRRIWFWQRVYTIKGQHWRGKREMDGLEVNPQGNWTIWFHSKCYHKRR